MPSKDIIVSQIHIHSGVGRSCLAFFISVAINLFIFIALANLNSVASVENRRSFNSGRCIFSFKNTPESRKAKLKKQDKLETRPEIMKVDLDLPQPQPVVLQAINLNLQMPELPAIAQYIIPRVPTVSKAKPQRHAQESKPALAPEPEAEEGLKHADHVDTPPKELVNPPPDYPRFALTRNIEGKVVVKLLIDECGQVEEVHVLKVEGHSSFRKAVLKVIHKWKFRPARHHGRSVKVWAIKRIRFELEG